jgi:GNAT superfamily N-acetyltransferase
MQYSGYQIARYRPEVRSQVVTLLQYLWDHDTAANLSYFKWKHEANPAADCPMGIVAVHQGQVVGFLGLVAERFHLPGQRDGCRVLVKSDACVHPDHRRWGLLVGMTNLATEAFAQECSLFFSTSARKNSLPGGLRTGYVPLVDRLYLSRNTLLGLAWYLPTARQRRPLEASRVGPQNYRGIQVSESPRPEQMAALSALQVENEDRFTLVRDQTFFEWRYRNPRGRYVFYYAMEGDQTIGYLVVKASRCNRRGYIVDFAAARPGSIRGILTRIIEMKHFDILSINSYCVDGDLWRNLHSLGFKKNSLLGILERIALGRIPLMVLPSQGQTGAGFQLLGRDIRRPDNWALLPIFDAAA